jgi:hypothetical protein
MDRWPLSLFEVPTYRRALYSGYAVRTQGLTCEAAGPHRVCESGLGFNLVTSAEIRNCAGWRFETQIASLRISGMVRLVHDSGSRAPEAAGIRVAAVFRLLGGASWMSS